MWKYFSTVIICFLLVLPFNNLKAQSGSCGPSGLYINYNDYVNYDRTVGGDLEISVLGYEEIGPNGNFDNYGAVQNNGVLEVDSGGILTIYGDMENNGSLIIHNGATINFYGKVWKNAPGSSVTDGAIINTIPGGDINFTASRPNLPPTWLVVSPCLNIYSGGDTIQAADGGNVPMDVVLRLNNPNNVVLVNTSTRIEGKLQWDVANGDIVLGNQDLIMSANAIQDGFREDRFAITNGTGHLVKENYTGNWIFPVGIADGDYTPAAINNVSANTMHVLVQNYATSLSDEALAGATADGIDRTWNIYADIATGNSDITLQHNSITNQAFFNDVSNFVTRWSNTISNATGDFTIPFSTSAWQSNTSGLAVVGILSSAGMVVGSKMRNRTYTDFALSSTNPIAFYSKSSDAFHPLPLDLLSFSILGKECSANIQFEIAKESVYKKFQLQHSTDAKTFSTIASFLKNNDSNLYNYVDVNAISGKNYYRVVLIEASGDYILSNILERNIDCKKLENQYVLYPNPASQNIFISGLSNLYEVRILDMFGRVLFGLTANSKVESFDISQLSAATYFVQVLTNEGISTSLKFIKE